MLRLDHLAFHGSLGRLRSGFARLGFQISPSGHYLSPNYPAERWANYSVFLHENWIDLIGSDKPATISPSACLFRAEDLTASIRDLATLVSGPRYTLIRHWDEDILLPAETFELAGLSWKAGQLRTSIIQHSYPCVDTRSEWFEHPNGARAIVGLTVAGEDIRDLPRQLKRFADLSWLSLKPSQPAGLTVTIGVTSITNTAATLAGNRVTFSTSSDSILVGSSKEIGCAWKFVE